MYRAVGEGRRWVKGRRGMEDAGKGRERERQPGTVMWGVALGTPRVNVDAVGIGVETSTFHIDQNLWVKCQKTDFGNYDYCVIY